MSPGDRRRPRVCVLVVLVGVLVAALTASCASPVTAAEALAFYDQMTEASAQRVAGMARFTAVDGRLDARSTSGRDIVGRDAQQDLLHQWFGQTMDDVHLTRLYVDRRQALVLYKQDPRGGDVEPTVWAALDTVDESGLAERVVLLSVGGDGEVPRTRAVDEAERLAEAHRLLWRDAALDDVDLLYAREARLVDSLLGIRLQGADAIAAHLADHPRSWKPTRSGITGVAAVFLEQTDPYSGTLTRVVAAVTADNHHQAVSLAVDGEGRVIEERRFHAADDLPRAAADAPAWWRGLTPPPAPADLPAQPLESAQGTVDVHGADEVTMQRLAWALGRFDEAGLETPVLGRIVVDSYGPACEKASGVAYVQPDSADLTVCPNAAALCADPDCSRLLPYPSQSLLHEMAHAWLDQQLPDARRDSFLTVNGLESWDDAATPWRERGLEVAAETVAWGLMDVPVRLYRIGDPDPGELSRSFTLLTGEPPLVPAGDQRDQQP